MATVQVDQESGDGALREVTVTIYVGAETSS